MAAYVSGSSLGLSTGSAGVLNLTQGNAAFGRGGEQVHVNVGSGNLVLQRQDELLVGRGPDSAVLRTYNSLGLTDGDNNDNWRTGFYRQLLLSGSANTSGSKIVRVEADGAEQNYSYDTASGIYRTSDGGGASDTLSYSAATGKWLWTDGASGTTETWQWNASLGRHQVLSQADASGNAVSYSYNSVGLLTGVTSANSSGAQQNVTQLVYDTASGRTANLLSIKTMAWDAASNTNKSQTRVRYAYDSSNRLIAVTVDLSPADNSIVDGRTWVTRYTYDGTSKRIATITAGDGCTLSFTYWSSGRIASMTDAHGGVTRFDYDNTTNARTTVTDPLGQATVYQYDSGSKQLQRITAPAVGGVAATRQFSYDSKGNVTRIVDGEGNGVDYQYDAHGNQTLQRDAAGNTITRSYNARNQLATETTYLTPDPDGAGVQTPGNPLTTRYVYDAAGRNQLRFVISPQGRVTEYRYDGVGQRISSIRYSAASYDASALSATGVPAEATLASWVNGLADQTRQTRTDLSYDFRGQLASSKTWDAFVLDASGKPAGVNPATTVYVYDPAGLLLQTIAANGGSSQTTTFVYDGLGRMLSSTDGLGQQTSWLYDDAGNKATQTLANGLRVISSYDKSARLTAVMQSDVAGSNLATTRYFYDKDNLLRLVTGPDGAQQWMLYDANDRKVGEVDGNGGLTEYVYNRNDQITQTIRYAGFASTANLTLNADGSPGGTALAQTLATLRPAASGADQKQWIAYDAAGRAVKTVDGSGVVSQTQYDASSRVIRHTTYASPIATSTLAASPTPASIAPLVNPASDRSTRYLYDKDGLLQAAIDAENNLTATWYDSAGRAWQQVAYATPLGAATVAAIGAGSSLASLLPASSSADIKNTTLCDARGNVRACIDGEGYLTEYVHDLNGNLTSSTRYATRLSDLTFAALAATSDIARIRPATSSADQTRRYTYDALNRRATETDALGIQTRYSYDSNGNLISVTSAAGTSAARVIEHQYDLQNRLIQSRGPSTGVYRAESSAILNAAGLAARSETTQIPVTQTGYDAAGRAAVETDSAGNRRYQVYDRAGRLRFAVDAEGYVTGYQRDALGNVSTLTRYAVKIGDATRAAWGTQAPDAASVARLLDSGNGANRSILTQYDALGRAIRITEPTVYAHDGVAASSAGQNTTHIYNAFGEIIRSSVGRRDGGALVSTHYFDRRGLESASVDALGYLTTQTYDAFGNVTLRTEYANPISLWDTTTYATPASDTSNDRRFAYSYDRENRRLSETRLQVEVADSAQDGVILFADPGYTGASKNLGAGVHDLASLGIGNDSLTSLRVKAGWQVTLYEHAAFRGATYNVSADRAGLDGFNDMTSSIAIVGSTRRDLVTRYGYDAFGNLISTTDAAGNVTRSYYDLNNRTRAVAGPARAIDGNAAFVPLTEFTRDSFGNVTRQTERANGAAGIADVSYTTSDSNADRISTSTYDSWGRVIQSTDALGNSQYFSWDEAGRLAKQWQGVTLANGLATVFKRLEYDRNGHLVHIVEPPAQDGQSAVDTWMEYNAFGELTRKYLAAFGRDQGEFYDYDNGGRVWRSNAGDGVVKVMLYDLQGNQTAVLASTSQDLKTVGSAAAADALTGLRRNTSQYDALGRVVRQNLASGGVIHQIWDRWGNCLSRSDARDSGMTTSWTYNASNQVIQQWQPSKMTFVETGAPGYASVPAQTLYYYDALGNLVATRDARGNVNGKRYDADGNVVSEHHADGGVTSHQYNAFGNEVRRTDTLGNQTFYSYDKLGRMTRIDRPWAWVNTAPSMDSQAVTLYYNNDYSGASRSLGLGAYNLYGNADGSISQFNDHIHSLRVKPGYKVILYSDPNFKGYVSTNDTWNGDAVIDEDRPNLNFGGVFDQWWKIASSIVIERDDETWPAYSWTGTAITMSYDELGRKLSVTNGAGERTSYGYDLRGNVTDVDQPGGRWTDTRYDALGRKIWDRSNGQNASGENGSCSWTYDYFGRLTGRQDLGGASYAYSYDHAGQLTRETNTRGRDTRYTYDGAGRLTGINDYVGDYVGFVLNQANTWQFMWGAQRRITDYAYDAAGHRISEKVRMEMTYTNGAVANTALQDQLLSYDSRGLLTDVYDNLVGNGLRFTYDAVGNRAREENWISGRAKYYRYDAMNRQILVDGKTDNSVSRSNIEPGVGHLVSYDTNGNRAGDEYRDSNGNVVIQTYAYDALNRLTDTTTNGTRTDSRGYDAADRLTYANGKDSQGAAVFFLNNYDNAGRLVYQSLRTNGVVRGFVSNQYDNAGNLSRSVRGGDGIQGVSSFLTLTSDYQYVRGFNGYQKSVITATRSDTQSSEGMAGDQGRTTLAYDVNGYLTSVTDQDNDAYTRYFHTDANGQVLRKEQNGNTVRNLIANGQVLMTRGTGVDPDNPITSGGGPNVIWQNSSDIAYQAIDAAHPGSGPGSYRVQPGDTLQGIAQGAYGDAGLWYLIADANGLSGNGDLVAGQLVSLPSTVGTVHNNAGTFKPYNAANIVGDTSPYTIAPSAGSNNCAQIGIIIAAVLVAVVVAVATAGAATAAIGAAAAAIGGTVATAAASTAGTLVIAAGAGAMAGVASSLASQGVLIAGGLQQGLNWADVGIGALTGFVGGAVVGGVISKAQAVRQAAQAGSFSSRVLNASLQSVRTTRGMVDTVRGAGLLATRVVATGAGFAALNIANDALGQGVRIAAGQQGAFDWRQTAAAAVAGAFSGAGSAGGLTSGIIGDLAGSALGELVTGDGRIDPVLFLRAVAGNISSVAIAGLPRISRRGATDGAAQRPLYMHASLSLLDPPGQRRTEAGIVSEALVRVRAQLPESHQAIYEIKWDRNAVPGGQHLGQMAGRSSRAVPGNLNGWVVDRSPYGEAIGPRTEAGGRYYHPANPGDIGREGTHFAYLDAIAQPQLERGNWWFRLRILNAQGGEVMRSDPLRLNWADATL